VALAVALFANIPSVRVLLPPSISQPIGPVVTPLQERPGYRRQEVQWLSYGPREAPSDILRRARTLPDLKLSPRFPADSPPFGTDGIARLVILQTGWPFPCLTSAVIEAVPDQNMIVRPTSTVRKDLLGGIWIPDPVARRFRPVPLLPVATAFAVDTALYALALAAPWIAAQALRSIRQRCRDTRNQCRNCGYPRGGGGCCPECGRAHARGRR